MENAWSGCPEKACDLISRVLGTSVTNSLVQGSLQIYKPSVVSDGSCSLNHQENTRLVKGDIRNTYFTIMNSWSFLKSLWNLNCIKIKLLRKAFKKLKGTFMWAYQTLKSNTWRGMISVFLCCGSSILALNSASTCQLPAARIIIKQNYHESIFAEASQPTFSLAVISYPIPKQWSKANNLRTPLSCNTSDKTSSCTVLHSSDSATNQIRIEQKLFL